MSRSKKLGSVLALFPVIALGCGQKAPPAGSTVGDTKKSAHDHHHGSGPHGGVIAEWGDGEYHVEFTVDHGAKEATVYVLGGDAKSPAAIKTPKLRLNIKEPAFETDLLAKPLAGESAGAASRFVGKYENLGIVREFAGTISGDVNGTPYAGDFREEPQ